MNLKNKMSFDEILKYAKQFFISYNINIDLDELIKDETIIFLDSDINESRHGSSYYDKLNNKRMISLVKREDILLLAVLIHEIMHYYNQPKDNNRNFSSEYLTEVISYCYELIAVDKFLNSRYEEDAITILKNTFYSLMYCAFYMYSPILAMCIYKNNNEKITKEEIEKTFKFESFKKEIITYINKRNLLSKDLWNLIGYYLAIYCFMEYKKDNSFINNLSELNNLINEKNIEQCLAIINIDGIDEIGSKAINNLDEYSNMLKLLDESFKFKNNNEVSCLKL